MGQIEAVIMVALFFAAIYSFIISIVIMAAIYSFIISIVIMAALFFEAIYSFIISTVVGRFGHKEEQVVLILVGAGAGCLLGLVALCWG